MSNLYEQDFYAWAIEQAALLRAGKLSAADIENIAEEIESMGKTEKRELLSRLTVLLVHLLKWQYQPNRRGTSWEVTIINQRDGIADHLNENPSLRATLDDAITAAYAKALLTVPVETRLPKADFPASRPWSAAQILDPAFWPGAPKSPVT
jgi:hypothetical protein